MRYLRLMGLLRPAPATIEQSRGRIDTGGIRRMGFVHDGSERLDGLFGVHSCQRRDFERSFSHLTPPRLPGNRVSRYSADVSYHDTKMNCARSNWTTNISTITGSL